MNLTSREALLLYDLTSYDTPEWNFIHCSDLCGLKLPISNVLMTIMLQDRMWKNEKKKKRPQGNPLSPRYFLTLHACEATSAQQRLSQQVLVADPQQPTNPYHHAVRHAPHLVRYLAGMDDCGR